MGLGWRTGTRKGVREELSGRPSEPERGWRRRGSSQEEKQLDSSPSMTVSQSPGRKEFQGVSDLLGR